MKSPKLVNGSQNMLKIQCLDHFLFLDETVICVLEDFCPQSTEAEQSHPLSSRQK